jgi:hypothetical protein
MLDKIKVGREEFKYSSPIIKSSIHNINYKKLKKELKDILYSPNKNEDKSFKSNLIENSPLKVETDLTDNLTSTRNSENDSLKFDNSNNIRFSPTIKPTIKTKISPSTTKRKSSLKNVETLCEKMPNFIKNYEDVLRAIDSNLKKEDKDDAHKENVSGQSPFKLIEYKTTKNFVKSEIESKVEKEDKLSNHINKLSDDDKNIHIDKLSQLITSTKKQVPELRNSIIKQDYTSQSVTLQSMTNTEDIKDFYEYTEACMKRIVKIKVTDLKEIENMMIDLPFENELKTQKKRLAIFDLDETLVHCESRHPERGQVQINVNLPDGTIGKVK